MHTETVDEFSREASRRHEEFVSWIKDHWPSRDAPLSDADFTVARNVLSALVARAWNASSEQAGTLPLPPLVVPEVDHDDESDQYRPVTPAPWP